MSVFFLVLAPEIVLLTLGPKWTEVTLPFQILATSLLFRTSYKISDSLTKATGAVYRRAWRQWVYAVLVVLGAFGGQFWGISGVAVGVVTAISTNYLLMAHLSLRLVDISFKDFFEAHIPGAVLGVGAGVSTGITATIGRNLDLAAFIAASNSDNPFLNSSFANSTIRMAFFAAIPISITKLT